MLLGIALYVVKYTDLLPESNIFMLGEDEDSFDVEDVEKEDNEDVVYNEEKETGRKVDFEKYRLGQTDQFKLPKFVYFDDFIDAIKTECFGNSTRDLSLPLSISSITPICVLAGKRTVKTFPKARFSSSILEAK